MNNKTIPIAPVTPDVPLRVPALPKGEVHRFHTMIKPSGSQCNLDCSYCFYLHKEDLLQQPKAPRMDDAVLATHIRQYIEAQTSDEVVFSWQGGEPTLMQLPFFEKVVALQQAFKKPGQRIENDLQTNGILLDDAWCDFLKRNQFLVGLSIDGPADLHNVNRPNKGGGPTFDRVMQAAHLLHQHAVPFSALCVVNNTNAQRPLDVYRFLRDVARPRMIQFIPCVEPTEFWRVAPGQWDATRLPLSASPQARPGQPDSVVTDWSVDPEDWGMFLARIWDEWFRRDFGRVFVDQFENIISQMFGHGPQKCVTAPFCGKSLALEHNGDLYSCDHFVYPEYRLGNIRSTHQGELAFSDAQRAFGYAKRDALPAYCNACHFLDLCWGECPKNRFVKSPDGEAGLNYLCPGLKLFYGKVTSNKAAIERKLRAARP